VTDAVTVSEKFSKLPPKNNLLDKNLIETVSCTSNTLHHFSPTLFNGTVGMTLTKEHLVNVVAEANGYPRNQAVELVETLLEIIKSKLVSGEDVLISGFGKFCVKKKRERRGRNPATGENMMLAARRVVTFKCSGQLKDKINKSQ
jgi:integration host factor subunit alpha